MMSAVPSACSICGLHADRDRLGSTEIWRDRLWLLRHHDLPSPLSGWCLLDARRHIGGPMDFGADEALQWGAIVQRASQLVKEVSGCERVYAIAFGEGARHLHLHLIPRHPWGARTAAWSVADLYRRVASEQEPAAGQEEVEAFLTKARRLAASHFL